MKMKIVSVLCAFLIAASAAGQGSAVQQQGTVTAGQIATFVKNGVVQGQTENFPPSGNIVGTTDSQTLTNKILTSPSITGSPTVNGRTPMETDIVGAVGNGTTDDTTAIATYLATLPATGSIIYLGQGKTYYLASSLTIPPNTIFDCQIPWGTLTSGSGGYVLSTLGGLRLGASATITLSAGARIQNCYIQPKAVIFPVQTPGAYTGTAINIVSGDAADVWVNNDLIVGFALCVDLSNGSDRFHLVNVECDGVTGYKIGASNDSSEIRQLRAWPWGTSNYSGSPTNARTGTGFLFTGTGRDDDIKVSGMTDFGHAVGLDIEDPSGTCCNIFFSNVWLDTNATTGAVLNSVGTGTTFDKLWIWTSGAPPITSSYQTTYVADLYINTSGGGNCASYTNNATLTVSYYQVIGCTANFNAPSPSLPLVLGANTPTPVGPSSAINGALQVNATGSSPSALGNGSILINNWNASASNGVIRETHSRGAIVGSNVALIANDGILNIVGSGADGTNYPNSVQILGSVDGAVSAGIVPGRIAIATTNSSGTLTQFAFFNSLQHELLGSSTDSGNGERLQITGSASFSSLTASSPVFTDVHKILTSTPPAGYSAVLSGTTASIGGGALGLGACATGTVTVTGATTGMAILTTPVTYPGAGFDWNRSYVSGANTVTVQVCADIAGTPTASLYNVRVLQ